MASFLARARLLPPTALRAKLVLLTVGGMLFAGSLIALYRIEVEGRRITETLARENQERASFLAEAVANLVVGYDYSNMEMLATRVAAHPDVLAVTVRDASGKLMVSRGRPLPFGEPVLGFEAPVRFGEKTVGQVELKISLAGRQAALARLYRQVLVEQLAIALILAALVYFGTSRVIVAPLLRLTRHMEYLRDHPDAPPPPLAVARREDEIGAAARMFSELHARLRLVQEQLRQKVDLAGTALMQTNEQLEEKTQELENRTRELEKALALLEKLAVTDSLTELHNRRYFDDALASAFARSQRFGEAICLVLLDVDHFKTINDRFGHVAGDAVLRALAEVLRKRARATDVVARLGGDEFAVLLQHAGSAQGMAFAASVLAEVRRLAFDFEPELEVSLSVGVAACDETEQSIEALYGAADAALYEAKRRGRDRAVAHPFVVSTPDPREAP